MEEIMSEESELVIHSLPDEAVGLENKDVLIKAMRSMASNKGDGRCLCDGCVIAWALAHFVDNPGAKWIAKAGERPVLDT